MAIITCPNCGAKNRVDETRIAAADPVCGRCSAKLSMPAQTSAGLITLTNVNFADEVLNSSDGKPILVDCWAPWCGPCRALEPTIKQLAAEAAGRWKIAKLNTDENQRIAAKYRIEGIPTMLIFRNGQLIDRIVGLAPKSAIESKLTQSSSGV